MVDIAIVIQFFEFNELELKVGFRIDHFVDQVLVVIRKLVCFFSGYSASRREIKTAASGCNTVDLLEVGLTWVEMSDTDFVEVCMEWPG